MANLKISILDVGHGDFIYAESPLGNNLVIDCGSGNIVPSSYLNKISTISELQVSHPHVDHFDDIVTLSKKKILSFRCPLLDNFSDEAIGWNKTDKIKIKRLREIKQILKADNNAVSSGDGFYHTVWAPSNVDYNDPNTASYVTTLNYNGFKMLFGGDLPENGWRSLFKNNKFVNEIKDATVFKVPHHGRKDGCCEELFELISPMLCIISDKAIEKDNENTVATDWYRYRSKGCNVVGCNEQRKVLSTRSEGSIFISVNDEGNWRVYPNTSWKE
ncbi:MAG: hypothetical protein M1147_00195 [Nitrospirae bacterium]|nr:hypothetical protein [Nitrospirota bacterium]MCL5976532.1 hypothetical protein [Nitrospirota bacterium]